MNIWTDIQTTQTLRLSGTSLGSPNSYIISQIIRLAILLKLVQVLIVYYHAS